MIVTQILTLGVVDGAGDLAFHGALDNGFYLEAQARAGRLSNDYDERQSSARGGLCHRPELLGRRSVGLSGRGLGGSLGFKLDLYTFVSRPFLGTARRHDPKAKSRLFGRDLVGGLEPAQ